MNRILFAGLPLLVGVLLLLRGCAALLGPQPLSGNDGESKILERLTTSKKSTAATIIGVAVVMTLVLALMAAILTLTLEIRVPLWMAYVIYGILIVGAAAFVFSVVIQVMRLFKSLEMKVVIAIFAVTAPLAWWFWPNWFTINLLAILIVLNGFYSFMQVTLNFKVVAVIGAGLFLYDIVNVYLTGNMMRLAEGTIGTKEAPSEHPLPFLVLVPDRLAFDASWAAALGMGDILLPGMLIMLAAVLAYRHNAMRVLYGGLVGYAVGLIAVFAILFITNQGQPALITLYPAVMAGILLTARREGLVRELLSMRRTKPPARQCGCKHHGSDPVHIR